MLLVSSDTSPVLMDKSRLEGKEMVLEVHLILITIEEYSNKIGYIPECCLVRTDISELASEGVKDLENYTSEHELHDKSTCKCDRGAEGIKRREEANEKWRQFYKTEQGIEIRNNYKEKQNKKKKLITNLLKIDLNKKAELQRETILKLIELL
ncbi:unnamed protein product [Psylliodes chrysocephalus]|uniref:Uncharacterized protein n=1 Tax=Psylliodes chrysocephalus TaxID=3402493 RepID=A0A9P0CLF0_9CUCU|nr:unnamed protein product [Psylliodes chrysocephala]